MLIPPYKGSAHDHVGSSWDQLHTLFRTVTCSLASFKSNGGKYGFKICSSLSSLARAILISTFPTSSNSLASVEVDILMVDEADTKFHYALQNGRGERLVICMMNIKEADKASKLLLWSLP
jgi:hypothetical protein